jgi:hypothetical protein
MLSAMPKDHPSCQRQFTCTLTTVPIVDDGGKPIKGGGKDQLAGLTVAIIIVLELPSRGSCTTGQFLHFQPDDCFCIGRSVTVKFLTQQVNDPWSCAQLESKGQSRQIVKSR